MSGVASFSASLPIDKMRCSVFEDQVAVWRYQKTEILLSATAAAVLAKKEHLEYDDLRL
jgi:hypothetical protein